MNIKRIIDKNGKLIWYAVLIIIFVLFAIKSLNSYYEKDEEKKQNEIFQNNTNNVTQNNTEKNYTTESNSIKTTMDSFVNYCNKKEVENAYKMLTDDCKKAMFPTIEDFKKIYIDNIYKVTRTYEMAKWLTNGNKHTYLVTLYGDILATGTTRNSTQEYHTFVEDDKGIYKLSINNYIYNKSRNLKTTVNNITVDVESVDVYDEYEEAKITITNNNSRPICLTGNKYTESIYIQSSNGFKYLSLNSEFENEELILEPGSSQTFSVKFNKEYDMKNQANYLIMSDIILDYEQYLDSDDKLNYKNRTSIKANY